MKKILKYAIVSLLYLINTGTLHAQEQHWQCDPYAWEYDMTVCFLLNLNNLAVSDLASYEIAAFCGTECRGIASIQSTEKDGQAAIYGYLRIRSNQQSGEVITFRAYDSVSEKEYDVEDYTLTFQAQNVIGLPSVPVQFSILGDCNISVSSADETKGKVEGSTTVKYGVGVTVTATANEGYHFVNWTVDDVSVSTDAIYTFTADGDISLVANFAPNQYTMTFVLDNGEGNVVKTQDYGTELTAPADPTKTGFTFKGWSPQVPTTVPASDQTFTAQWERNSYKLTWSVDGEVYKTDSIDFETPLVAIAEPTKEGYTFSGWSEIPATMPANDVVITGAFKVNKYLLTYQVDGEVFESDSIVYNSSLTPIAEPTKEGYTFSGWSEIPETMPANNVVITGAFKINKYLLTYKVDDEIFKSDSIVYNATINPETAPTKEGYTFSGWSEIPETMPAQDVVVTGTFKVNKYLLTYKVDDEIVKSDSIVFNTAITPEAEPTKEGYTFSGWSAIPETMPAKDVVVTGTFKINKYLLTYKVDDEIVKSDSIVYNTAITPEAEPTKEGYTFSGWSEIPETMPAQDVVITGSFKINKYLLTYKVDDEIVKSDSIVYNTAITPEAEPTKEGYTFSGWSEIPETMPAKDVLVTGTFSINSYKLTYMIDDKVYKDTVYEYSATIIPEPIPAGNYATFEWIDLPETMPAHDVVVHASYTTGIREMILTKPQDVQIYSPNGKKLNKLQKGLNIVRMSNGTTKKVVVK